MTKEIELKFRVENFGNLREKLKKLGAKLEWKGKEENWYFDTPNNGLRKKDSALRIKRMGDVKLTLKEGRHIERGVKVATEYQVVVDDPHIMKIILEKLGFDNVLYYRKYREHWRLGNAYIELDTLNSKRFVEIEAFHKLLKELVYKLGLDFTKSTTKSYTHILKEKMTFKFDDLIKNKPG